jgi:hypothetical protein
MPIIDADFPIIDQQVDLKIDTQVERIYLYRISSSTNSDFRNGLRFSQFRQKHEGLNTFISEDGAYYISAFRISGTGGYWIIAPTIGQASCAANRINSTFIGLFFPRGVPVEGTYGSTVVISKITSDTR